MSASSRWWILLLPLLASSCWVTNTEVQRKVRDYDQEPVETADTGR